MIDVEKHNDECLVVFSALSVVFLAIGAHLTSGTSSIDKALGFASYGMSILSLLADVYTGLTRFLKFRVTPLLSQAQNWAVKEIKNPTISSITEVRKSANKITLAIGAVNSDKSYEEMKQLVQGVITEMEKDKDFWDKHP